MSPKKNRANPRTKQPRVSNDDGTSNPWCSTTLNARRHVVSTLPVRRCSTRLDIRRWVADIRLGEGSALSKQVGAGRPTHGLVGDEPRAEGKDSEMTMSPPRPATPQSTDVRRDRPMLPLERARALQALRDARRARNRQTHGAGPDETEHVRCECARVDCRVRLPFGVERHRRRSWQFIVAPSHAGADRIVGAADGFFVVESVADARAAACVAAAPESPEPTNRTVLPRTPRMGSVERLLRDTPETASAGRPSEQRNHRR
jgi:hypothetical protein